jgi:hypothetical protein
MPTSDVASKGAQGALFALAGLCFLLPFVSLSCSSEEFAEGMAMEKVDQDLTGAQLLKGGATREGFDPANVLPGGNPDRAPEFPMPAEPFAVIALAAALVGFAFVFVRVTRTRLLGASIAGAAGAASLLLLATSPTLRALGFSAVTLLYGFWIALGIFGLAAIVHLIQLRFERREATGEQRAPETSIPPPGPSP